MTQEILHVISLNLDEKILVPAGFKRCFITYDRDTQKVIVCLTNDDSPSRR